MHYHNSNTIVKATLATKSYNIIVQQCCTTVMYNKFCFITHETCLANMLPKHKTCLQNILLKHKTSLDNILPNTSEREQWCWITEAKMRNDKLLYNIVFVVERCSICTTLLYNTIKESVLSAIITRATVLTKTNFFCKTKNF